MIRRNGFINPKVIRTTLLLVFFVIGSQRLALGIGSSQRQWVDSVFHALSEEDRIRQLLFPITNQGTVPQGVGGVITYHSRPLVSPQDPQGITLRGVIPVHLLMDELGLSIDVLGATGNANLLEQAGTLSGQQLVGKGHDFLYLPQQFLPEAHADPARNYELNSAFIRGLSASGLGLWTEEHTGQAMELEAYLATRGILLSELKKKDLKSIWKEPAGSGLRFYHAHHDDLELPDAVLASDVLVFEGDHQFYFNLVSSMITSRKLKPRVFEARVRKVLALKYRQLIKDHAPVQVNEKRFRREVFEQAPILVNNSGGSIPVLRMDNRSFASLSFGVYGTDVFTETLSAYTQFDHYGEPDYFHDASRLKSSLNHYDYVIAGFSFPNDVALQNQDIQERIQFLEDLSQETNVVVVVFAESKWLLALQNLETVLWVHSSEKDFLQIAPQIIFGALPAKGQLTHNLGDVYAAGHGHSFDALSRLKYNFPEYASFDPAMEQKIDYIVTRAIENFATPGCQVLVARKGNVVLNKGYGYFTYDSLREVSKNTIYDLASVTKVVGTLQATMFLQGHGAISLDSSLSSYLQELRGTNKEALRIRDILTHQAGLQSYFPFYKRTYRGDRLNPQYIHLTQESQYNQRIAPGLFGHSAIEDSVWNWTINSKLRKKPEWRSAYDYKYSDLGFLMMFVLNERLTNQPMEDFLSQNFYEPLGMTSTGYQPTCRFPINRIAPTEVDYDFRNALIWGMVHDENAAITGGVGGHAGLFSTANDIAKLMQMNLQDGHYGGIDYIPSGTVEGFARKQFAGNRRGLGWDKPSLGDYQNTARHSSRRTFGHLGFTGTAVWVDPEFDLIYIFLSNRVHPNRQNDKLMVEKIRTRIHEVIYQSMPEFSGD